MSPVDLSHVLRNYENKWVALNRSETEVLAHGNSPEEVRSLALKKSSERPIVMLVPRFDADYVG